MSLTVLRCCSTPLSLLLLFDVLLKMSPVIKAFFFSPLSLFLPCIRARQFAVAHPPTQNAYRFPPLSGSQLPASEMTFPASLCCPTDVLSENKPQMERKQWEWLRRLGHYLQRHFQHNNRHTKTKGYRPLRFNLTYILIWERLIMSCVFINWTDLRANSKAKKDGAPI